MPFFKTLKKIILRVVEWEESATFGSRWVTLAPMSVALILATLLYELKFFHELYLMLIDNHQHTLEDVMLSLLGLFDAYMVVNLAYTIKAGSWSIFVREVHDVHKKPRVLNNLTSGSLKVKMSTSFLGITGVYLLKDFIGAEQLDWQTLYKQCMIHGVFLVSTLVLVYAEKNSSHGPTDDHADKDKAVTEKHI